MTTTSRGSRVLAVLTLTMIALGGTASSRTAFAKVPSLDEPSVPSLEIESGDSSYRASANLGGLALPLINVTNPSEHRYTTVRIVAWNAKAEQGRWFLVNLEPQGSSTLSLEGADRFAHLSFAGKEEFSVELLNADDDQRRAVPVFQDRGPVARGTLCHREWKLTCQSGGCSGLGPFTALGKVVNGDQVYWNENTPTGSWTTIGDQGITATWAHGSGPCPTSVTNSLGHTYDIEIIPEPPECEDGSDPPCEEPIDEL